jgi:hypothetical protein
MKILDVDETGGGCS